MKRRRPPLLTRYERIAIAVAIAVALASFAIAAALEAGVMLEVIDGELVLCFNAAAC